MSMHGNTFQNIPVLDNEGEEPARLVSVEDAARMLAKITTRHVYNLFDDGELETVKLGRRRCVVVASIDAYVDRLREASQDHAEVA